MKPKMAVKICIDIGMIAGLLFLMAYELIGQAAHEWLGIGMFVLFIAHHILNRRWWGRLAKGRYTLFRLWQTLLVFLALASMLGSMVSGVILSRHALAFLPISGGRAFGRNLHMLSAYWGFVVMSLHLGLHWSMMMKAVKKLSGGSRKMPKGILRIIALLIAVYGLYAFVKRDIGSYMFLKIQFAFFDFEEPLLLFMLDYLAVMGLLVAAGYYLAKGLRQSGRKNVK